jgi:hypothetical protein
MDSISTSTLPRSSSLIVTVAPKGESDMPVPIHESLIFGIHMIFTGPITSFIALNLSVSTMELSNFPCGY